MVLRVFRERIRGGIATLPYPLSPEAAPPAYRGQVLLDTSRCQGDGACEAACPAQAIAVERDAAGWTWTLTDARCVFCGLCEEACPSLAIRLSNEFELAVRDAKDLIISATFERGSAQ